MTNGLPNRQKTTTELAEERTTLAGQRTELADERTSLAVLRTVVALDRTLMAWVRTATALISFGFTLYKVFQSLPATLAEEHGRLLGPRGVALLMIGLAVGGVGLATIDYRRRMSMIRERYKAYGPFPRSLAETLAAVISGLGIAALVLIVLRQ